MRGSRRLVAVLLGVVAPSACGTPDRPPPSADCTAGGCITKGPQVTSSSGSSSTPNDGGTGAVSGQDAGDTATLSGTVGVIENEQFATQTAFDGTGTVGGEAPSGRVTADFTGSTFSLSGVLQDTGIWVDLQATATTLDLMSTLTRVDASSGGLDGASSSAQLVFVRTATMENVGAALQSPVSLDPSRGHAVLTFVDSSGNGVSGVLVTSHTGDNVAYDTGNGVYRDDQPGTTAPGRAIVLNAQALAFPGAVTRFSYTATRSGAIDVKLAAGAVTLLTVRVP